jgi:hypothetical protein
MRSAVALSVCASLLACAPEPSTHSRVESRTVVQRTSGVTVSEATRDDVLRSLEASVPEWDDAELTNTPEASRSGFPFERAIEMAQSLSPAYFEYLQTRAKGTQMFRNPERTATVLVDASRGYWKLMAPVPASDDVAASFSLKDAESAADELYDRFNLPREQEGAMISSDIAGRSSPEEPPTIEARYICIHRIANGLGVMDSHLWVSYDLDGTVLQAEVRWPAFQLKKADRLRSRTQAIEDVGEVIAARSEGGRRIASVSSDVVYEFNEQEKVFVPTLRVATRTPRGAGRPDLIRYSLVDGQIQVDF